MASRLAGVLVDALFPPAADALARALDEVGGRLLFGGGGGGSGGAGLDPPPTPHFALGVVARQQPAEASSSAPSSRSAAKVQVRGVRGGDEGAEGQERVVSFFVLPLTSHPPSLLLSPQILVRPGPLDPREFFAKLPKLAAVSAAHASLSTAATGVPTAADAEAGAAALKSFAGLIARAAAAAAAAAVAAGSAPASSCSAAPPAVHVFAHGYGAHPAAWSAALAACPPGVAIKFHALPSGLPPSRAAQAGLALARFAEDAVRPAEAASLAVLGADPAALRASVLAGLFRDLAGCAAPAPVTLHLPTPVGTALACVVQAEVAPLATPVVRGGGRTCPCHGAPAWTAGATPSYPAAVCPVTGRALRLEACPPDARSLRLGGGGGGRGTPLTLAHTAAAAATAEEAVLPDDAASAGPPSLHIVACVPAASLDAGALYGVPAVLMADPLADDDEEEEGMEEEGGGRPARPPHRRRAFPPGGPRGHDPFAGPSDDDDFELEEDEDEGEEEGDNARPPPAGHHHPPSVCAFAGLCAALRLRGDALVAAARADLLAGGGSLPPTSLLRYYALRPAGDADCLLAVGLAGDEERVPLTVAPPAAGAGGDGPADLAVAAAALDAVRIAAGVGPASLACGLRDRLPALAARCVATPAVVPPLPAAGGGGGGGGDGGGGGGGSGEVGGGGGPRPPAAGGNKRRKPLAAAAAAALCLSTVRE
jgi:hypothetical protein